MAATAPSMVAGYRLLLPLQHLPARPAFLPLSTPDPDKSLAAGSCWVSGWYGAIT
jgi:hypothetical protein